MALKKASGLEGNKVARVKLLWRQLLADMEGE